MKLSFVAVLLVLMVVLLLISVLYLAFASLLIHGARKVRPFGSGGHTTIIVLRANLVCSPPGVFSP
jgi:hypothetical protein